MRTRLTLRRTRWGWSLYARGELVGSCDDPRDVLRLMKALGLISRG